MDRSVADRLTNLWRTPIYQGARWELRAGFLVDPCVLHRIELLFQWYSHWCAKKNAIEYLPSDTYAVASRRPLLCSSAWIIRPYAGRYHYLLVLLSDVGTIACAA